MLADVGMERAVLSGICQFGKDGLIEVDDIVSVSTFTITANQMVFKCLKEALTNYKSVDIATIVSTANDMGLFESIAKNKTDIEYLRSLFTFPIKLENLRDYAKKIGKLEFTRNAQSKHKEAYDNLGSIKGVESLDEIIAISEKPIFDLMLEANKGKSSGPVLITEGASELLEQILQSPTDNIGLPTPWAIYNAAIGGGLRRGGVNLIGARPKRGKTTLAKEVALHATLNLKVPVLVLDTEMNQYDQVFRSLASLSKVNITKIETGKFGNSHIEKQKVLMAMEKLKSNFGYYYVSIAGKPFDEVLSIIRRWILKHVGFAEDGSINNCLVIYDYFKLMNKGDLNGLKEYEAMGYQISNMTDFSKEYDFPVLAFVQLNREEDISQSDRLRWLCHSYSQFLDKTPEQLVEDGPQNGNRTLTIHDTRFGPGLDSGDYICMSIDGGISTIKEINLKSRLRNQINQNGFVVAADDEDESTETI